MDALVRLVFYVNSRSDEGVQPANGITTEHRISLTQAAVGFSMSGSRGRIPQDAANLFWPQRPLRPSGLTPSSGNFSEGFLIMSIGGLLPLTKRPSCLYWSTWRLAALTALLLAVLLAPAIAAGQPRQPKEKLPEPETLTLSTKDGVQLRCTYYGSLKEKEAVPIILLHGWGGRRTDFDAFASALQSIGHAVIVPDLRGHGDSTERRSAAGGTTTIDSPEEMNKTDVANMVLDVEACKKFLLEQNNEEKLNIELLTVVGVDVSGVIALNWAALDWSAVRLPTIKQGQDVKALVLISPQQSFRGVTTRPALAHKNVRADLSVMIMVGKNDRGSYSDAKRLHSSLARYHEEPEAAEIEAKKDLFLEEFDTSLQGKELLQQPSLRTAEGLSPPVAIARFIKWRLVDKSSSFPWTQRRRGE